MEESPAVGLRGESPRKHKSYQNQALDERCRGRSPAFAIGPLVRRVTAICEIQTNGIVVCPGKKRCPSHDVAETYERQPASPDMVVGDVSNVTNI